MSRFLGLSGPWHSGNHGTARGTSGLTKVPATQNQTADRAHRIGQVKNVMAYRLVAKDTIEAKVMDDFARFSAAITAGNVRGLFDV